MKRVWLEKSGNTESGSLSRVVFMAQVWQTTLWILASFSVPVVIAMVLNAVMHSVKSHPSIVQNGAVEPGQVNCQTLIADPNPPLNIRSSPVAAEDNKIATLPNGTTLTIVDEQNGWLRINSPLQGWVYKELTVTSCIRPNELLAQGSAGTPATAEGEQGHQLLAIATEQYQSGRLDGAIALVQTVSPRSPAYPSAQHFIKQWQQDWHNAESRYYVAQKALRDGRWQDVLNQVGGYPANRYWRERLAVVVQQAIQQDQTTSKRL